MIGSVSQGCGGLLTLLGSLLLSVTPAPPMPSLRPAALGGSSTPALYRGGTSAPVNAVVAESGDLSGSAAPRSPSTFGGTLGLFLSVRALNPARCAAVAGDTERGASGALAASAGCTTPPDGEVPARAGLDSSARGGACGRDALFSGSSRVAGVALAAPNSAGGRGGA